MTDTNADGPRLARPTEFDEILDLVDRCFHHPDGGMAAQWQHCYDEARPERHAVVARDGRVVSHVGVVEDTLVVDGGELRCWGITGVATDPRYRGEGHMTDLVEFWLDRMDSEGVPLSKLGGDRQRYGRYGWEHAGRESHYRLTERSVLELPERDEYVERYDGSDRAVKSVREQYRTKRFRVRRDADAIRTRLGRSHLETLLYTESGHEAYLTFTRTRSKGQRTTVTEVAGVERGVRALVAHLFRVFDLSTIGIRLHPSDPLNGLFGSWDVSAGWETNPHRSVNVRDLPRVLAAYEPLLSERWGEIGGAPGSITLGIQEDDEAVEIEWTNARVAIARTDSAPTRSFDRLETARLLFGYPETVADYDGHPFLDAVTPLPFYVPRTDQV